MMSEKEIRSMIYIREEDGQIMIKDGCDDAVANWLMEKNGVIDDKGDQINTGLSNSLLGMGAYEAISLMLGSFGWELPGMHNITDADAARNRFEKDADDGINKLLAIQEGKEEFPSDEEMHEMGFVYDDEGEEWVRPDATFIPADEPIKQSDPDELNAVADVLVDLHYAEEE